MKRYTQDPPLVDEKSLPKNVQDAILSIYEWLDLEPTSVTSSVNSGRRYPYIANMVTIHFGAGLRLYYYESSSGLAVDMATNVNHLEPSSFGDSLSEDVLRELAGYMMGVEPPPEIGSDATYCSLGSAVNLAYRRRWDSARSDINSWFNYTNHDCKHELRLVYLDFVDRHERACRSAGLDTPLRVAFYHDGGDDDDHFYSFILELKPTGGGTFTASADISNNDGDGDCQLEDLRTRDDCVRHLDWKIADLQNDLADARRLREALNDQSIDYVYSGPDPEDEENDDDD